MNEGRESVSGAQHDERPSGLFKAGAILMTVLAFVAPFFFIPYAFLPVAVGKNILLIVMTLTTLFVLALIFLKRKRLTLPAHPLFLAVLGLMGVYGVSSLFSVSGFSFSLMGYGGETYTFAVILLLFTLFFVGTYVLNDARRSFLLHVGILTSALFLALFFVARFIFGVDVLLPGFFPDLSMSPLGPWSGSVAFFALILLLVLIALDSLKVNTGFRVALGVLGVFSLFIIILGNSTWIWLLMGAFILLFIILRITEAPEREGGASLPVLSMAVLFISVSMVFLGAPVATSLQQVVPVQDAEIRPSWGMTTLMTRETMSDGVHRALFGSGPVDFSHQWERHKTSEVAASQIWNSEFGLGTSFMSSVPVTTGLAGVVAWVTFIVLFVFVLARGIMRIPFTDVISRYVFLSSSFGSLFLLSTFFFFNPPHTLLILFFVLASTPIALLTARGELPVAVLSLSREHRSGFISMLAVVLVLGTSLIFGGALLNRAISTVFFEQAFVALHRDGDTLAATENISWALTFSEQDRYHRFAAELPVIRLRSLLQQQNMGVSEEELSRRVVSEIQGALFHVERAARLRPRLYHNWMTVGDFYHAITPLNIADRDTRAEAHNAYEVAREFSPNNPAIPLSQGRLEFIVGDLESARSFAREALEIKPNYANALFFMAQIEVEEGDVDNAIASVRQAISSAPRDPGLRFHLGLLYYGEGDFESAARAFDQAAFLAPQFDNAWYFLSLSLFEAGNEDLALEVMGVLVERYPENREIRTLYEDMQEGHIPDLGEGADGPRDLPLEESIPEEEDGETEDDDREALFEETEDEIDSDDEASGGEE